MIASISNVAKQATVTVDPASALQDINVVTDGDFSSVFVDTLAGKTTIKFVFAEPQSIGYIAIGGSNISTKDSILVSASTTVEPVFWQTIHGEQVVSTDPFDITLGIEGTFDDSSLGLNQSCVMMYKTDFEDALSVIIEVSGGGQLSIAEIAMGEYYEIPRGEQAGYNRPWTVPNIKARSSVGLNNSPVNLSYESRSLSCTLSVPNNVMRDFDGWYSFINYAANNTFYILEDLDRFHSYAGFNAVPAMTSAHAQTRSLGVSSIKFNAFAKSTEALF